MRIKTRHFLIEPFVLGDIDGYFDIVSDPKVMQYLGHSGMPLTRAEARQYVESCIESEEQHGFSRYAVRLRDTSELIGMCGFKQMPDYVDLGFRYASVHWQKGYGYEAAEAVVNYGLSKLDLPEIVACAHKRNVGSVRIIERLGFVFQMDVQTVDGDDVARYHRLR